MPLEALEQPVATGRRVPPSSTRALNAGVAHGRRPARPAAAPRSPGRRGCARSGCSVHSSPSSRPTGRGATCAAHRDPVARSRRRAARAGAASRRRAVCTSENESGRPDSSAMRRKIANSASTSVKSETTCSTPCPVAPMALGDADQLVRLGGERRRRLAPAGAVVQRARGREAERAGLDRLAAASCGHRARCRRRSPARGCAPRSPITCRRSAPCGTCTATSTSNGRPSSASRNSGNDCQSQRQALVEHDAGDVLDALHQLDEPVVVGRAHRREADAAVAGDDGGDAVPRRRDHPLAPRRLPVVVGVDVDEAGRHQQPVGVDASGRPLRRRRRPR